MFYSNKKTTLFLNYILLFWTSKYIKRLDNPSSNLFGYFVLGCFGMNVIIDFIIISKLTWNS